MKTKPSPPLFQWDKTSSPQEKAYLVILHGIFRDITRGGRPRFARLRLLSELAYRLMGLNFKSTEAHLVLAYIFGALGETPRAYQILLQAERSLPENTHITESLTYFKALILKPKLQNQTDLDAVSISFENHKKPLSDSPTESHILDLPSLEDTLKALDSSSQENLEKQNQYFNELLFPMLERVSQIELS